MRWRIYQVKDTQKERKRWGWGERRRAECGGGSREGGEEEEAGRQGRGQRRRKENGDS